MRNLSEHIGFHDPNEMFDSIMINAAVCTNVFHAYIHQVGNLHTDVIIQALSSVRICGNLNLNISNEDTAITINQVTHNPVSCNGKTLQV